MTIDVYVRSQGIDDFTLPACCDEPVPDFTKSGARKGIVFCETCDADWLEIDATIPA